MNNFNNKKLKAILFFGFYFIFFLFIFIYVKSNNITINSNYNQESEKVVEEKIKTYSINHLMDNNYSYHFVINDNDKEIIFNGTKDNIDYDEFDNKYFLDIYNDNQIIKNSKYIDTKDNVLSYEVSNFLLSALVNGSVLEGNSKVDVYVDGKGNLVKVILDLSSFMQKDKYLITLNYEVGDDVDKNNIS